MSSDTTVTVNPAMNKAVDLLEQLSEKLGVTADHMWELMVAQANVEIITYIFTVITFIFAVFFLTKSWKKADDLENTEVNSTKHYFFVGLTMSLILISIVSGLGTLFGFDTFVTCIANPEYWAFKEIMDMIN